MLGRRLLRGFYRNKMSNDYGAEAPKQDQDNDT